MILIQFLVLVLLVNVNIVNAESFSNFQSYSVLYLRNLFQSSIHTPWNQWTDQSATGILNRWLKKYHGYYLLKEELKQFVLLGYHGTSIWRAWNMTRNGYRVNYGEFFGLGFYLTSDYQYAKKFASFGGTICYAFIPLKLASKVDFYIAYNRKDILKVNNDSIKVFNAISHTFPKQLIMPQTFSKQTFLICNLKKDHPLLPVRYSWKDRNH